jgi:hypothetical protein
MATTLYLRHWNSSGGGDKATTRTRIGTGAVYTDANSTSRPWDLQSLETTRGSTNTNGWPLASTVTGPTNPIELVSSGVALFVSPPLSASVTVSGAITLNVWAREANMTDNAAINFRVMKLTNGSGGSNTLSEVGRSARTTELGTSFAAANFNFTPGAGVSFNRGDRIVLSLYIDDAGTMGSGGYGYAAVSGPTAAAAGDSYVTFTETFSFDSTPAGSTVYLTNDGAGINPGSSTELLAWGNRGTGVSTAVTATSTNPSSPIQMTDTSGGTALEWYTPGLEAVTLQGSILVNCQALQSNLSANATTRCEIAVVDSDGTNASVWGWGGGGTDTTNSPGSGIELTDAEASAQYYVAGADKSITSGQRLRIRFYIDDAWGQHFSSLLNGMASGYTTTMYYGASSGGGSGDTYITFSQTLTFKPLTQTKSFTVDAIVTNAWGWKSPPADGAGMFTTPALTFATPKPGGSSPQTFEIELDTSSSFNTANLRHYRVGDEQGTWEYHNGSTWVTMPANGMPSAYKGNDARFSPPALEEGTWYRRIRYGVNGT